LDFKIGIEDIGNRSHRRWLLRDSVPIRLAAAWEWASRRKYGLGNDQLGYFEGDTKMNYDRPWAWWLLLPVIALGYLLVTIAKASTESIFDD
jgi:hypothetical protein